MLVMQLTCDSADRAEVGQSAAGDLPAIAHMYGNLHTSTTYRKDWTIAAHKTELDEFSNLLN